MRSSLSLCVILCTISSTFAAEPVRDDLAVQKAFTKAFDAIKLSDWKSFAATMHPDALKDVSDPITAALKEPAADPKKRAEILVAFFAEKDPKVLLAKTPEDLFASLLTGIMSSYPKLKIALTSMDIEIIGTVYEKDGTAHVVYRGKMQTESRVSSKVAVASLKKSGDSWRMLLLSDFKGVADQLSRSLKGQ